MGTDDNGRVRIQRKLVPILSKSATIVPSCWTTILS